MSTILQNACKILQQDNGYIRLDATNPSRIDASGLV